MRTSFTVYGTTALLVSLVGTASAQQPPASQLQRRHTGKIIRSFTEPYRKSVAASVVPGIVVDVVAKEGDRVTTGDPLVRLNRSVLEASLEIAKARAGATARVDAAASQFELLKSQLQALQALKKDGHTNRYELEQKQAEYQQAFSEYRAAQDDQVLAKLEVKRIEAELGDRTILSPISGFVTEIHKQPGENLSSTEPQYATIVSLEKLRVRFYVGAARLREFRPGNTVVVDVGKNRKQVQAIVSYVSPTIDSDSGVGRLEVLLDNSKLTLQSGVVAFWNEPATASFVRANRSQRAGQAQTRRATGTAKAPVSRTGFRPSTTRTKSAPGRVRLSLEKE